MALRLVFMARRVSRFLFDLIEGGARWPAAAVAAASEAGGRLRQQADRNSTDQGVPSPLLEFGLGAGAAAAAPDSNGVVGGAGRAQEVGGLRPTRGIERSAL